MTAEHSGWRNPRILLTLLVVFLCGASAGMVAFSMGFHHWLHGVSAAPAPSLTGKNVSLDRLKTELNLTPAQTQELDLILDDFFTYYHTLQAQLDDVRASGKQRILRILDDNQKKKFEKLMTEMQEKQLH